MSAFNTVRGKAACPACGVVSEFDVQFKYGNTWQLEYQVGDELKWGGNDTGNKGIAKVAVEGTGGACPNCNADFLEFDVIVEKNILSEIVPVGVDRADESELGYRVLEE